MGLGANLKAFKELRPPLRRNSKTSLTELIFEVVRGFCYRAHSQPWWLTNSWFRQRRMLATTCIAFSADSGRTAFIWTTFSTK